MSFPTPLDIKRDNPTPAEWHRAVTSGRSLAYNGLPVLSRETAHLMGFLAWPADYPEASRWRAALTERHPHEQRDQADNPQDERGRHTG